MGGGRDQGPGRTRDPGYKYHKDPASIHNATLDIRAYAEKLLHRSLRTAEPNKRSGLRRVARILLLTTTETQTPTETLRGSPTMRTMSEEEDEKMSSQVLKEGELEKRSDNLLQFWKRKTCVLTAHSLSIYADAHKRTARSKELKLRAIRKVDCVERTGKCVYFTIVTTDDKEIDFRCSAEEEHRWNAAITMALIDYQNRRAVQDFKTRQDQESASPGQQERRLARAP